MWHVALEQELKSLLDIPRHVHTYAIILAAWTPRPSHAPPRERSDPLGELVERPATAPSWRTRRVIQRPWTLNL